MHSNHPKTARHVTMVALVFLGLIALPAVTQANPPATPVPITRVAHVSGMR